MTSICCAAASERRPQAPSSRCAAPKRAARALVGLIAGWACGDALAHEFRILAVRGEFRPDGAFEIELRVDVDALVIGQRPGSVTIEQERALAAWTAAEWAPRIAELERYFSRRVRLRFDGVAVEPRIEFPDLAGTENQPEPPGAAGAATAVGRGWENFEALFKSASSSAARAATRPSIRANHTVRLSGRVPEGAKQFTFWASRSFGPAHLLLRGPAPDAPVMSTTGAGIESAPFRLDAAPVQPGWSTIAWRYLGLGFEHIIPLGVDHILFVLALFLLSDRLGPLLWQITAFTLAHSLTLGLSMMEVVSLPSSVVEPLIAFSIALVAAENVFTARLRPWRPAVVFAFGLLHGLGFAGVLRELGIPDGTFAIALASFNVGVELGQLAVVGAAALCIWRWKGRPWFRPRVTMPASAAISVIGIVWTVSRIWF